MSLLKRLPALMLMALAAVMAERPALADAPCEIGAYRLTSGAVVDIGLSNGGPSDVGLRWRMFDGETGLLRKTGEAWTSTRGWTDHPDGKTVRIDCGVGQISFAGEAGQRIAFDVRETKFRGDGVDLAGRLVLPKGSGPAPIVVLVHGSEDYSALDFYALQRLLPAEGVGVFVYDKRGTGLSSGAYTQDFSRLAHDAVAAEKEARRLAGARAGRIGYLGTSQGGWVAPMAGLEAPVDFIVVAYGLAVSPLEENRAEIRLEMALKGHGAQETKKALQVAKAGEAIILSGFTKGFDAFAALKARYSIESWWPDLHGNYTYMLLPLDTEGLKANKAQFILGTPWRYDPVPALRASKTPQLWILGADDLKAPSASTAGTIKALGAEGRSFTLAMVPHADHGLMEFETDAKGERTETRVADGYYAMVRDFALTGALSAALSGRYGAAEIIRPKAR